MKDIISKTHFDQLKTEPGEVEKIIQLLLLSSNLDESVTNDQQFTDCIAQLVSLSLDQLAEVPVQIKAEENRLRKKNEQLAVENYPIFLANADTSREVHQEFESISKSNETLLSRIAEASSSAQLIFKNVEKYALSFRVNAKSIQNHTQILELLELPQLMETCVQNGYYEDALNILTHTKHLSKKYGDSVPIIKLVAYQAQQISGHLFHQLCKQLREPITLPVCLKVVVYLRQLEAFTEEELRLKFLQARGTCLSEQMSVALCKPIGQTSSMISNADSNELPSNPCQRAEYEAYIGAMRRIEVTRVQLFDSITQYRAVFADEELHTKSSDSKSYNRHSNLADINPLNLDEALGYLRHSNLSSIDGLSAPNEGSLFHAWLVRQISIFITALTNDLKKMLNLPLLSANEVAYQLNRLDSKEGSESGLEDTGAVTSVFHHIHSLMTQSLYFGRSFARIGCDFRPHFAIKFSDSIMTYFKDLLENALTVFSVTLDLWPWESDVDNSADSINNNGETSLIDEDKEMVKAPPLLLRHPPLAIFCNHLLIAFNGLRIACPLGLKERVVTASAQTVHTASRQLITAYRSKIESLPSSSGAVANIRGQALRTASAFTFSLTPHILTCLLTHLFAGEEENVASRWNEVHVDPRALQHSLAGRICTPLFTTWPQLSSLDGSFNQFPLLDSISLASGAEVEVSASAFFESTIDTVEHVDIKSEPRLPPDSHSSLVSDSEPNFTRSEPTGVDKEKSSEFFTSEQKDLFLNSSSIQTPFLNSFQLESGSPVEATASTFLEPIVDPVEHVGITSESHLLPDSHSSLTSDAHHEQIVVGSKPEFINKQKLPDSFTLEHNASFLDSSSISLLPLKTLLLESGSEVEATVSTCLELAADPIDRSGIIMKSHLQPDSHSSSVSGAEPNIIRSETAIVAKEKSPNSLTSEHKVSFLDSSSLPSLNTLSLETGSEVKFPPSTFLESIVDSVEHDYVICESHMPPDSHLSAVSDAESNIIGSESAVFDKEKSSDFITLENSVPISGSSSNPLPTIDTFSLAPGAEVEVTANESLVSIMDLVEHGNIQSKLHLPPDSQSSLVSDADLYITKSELIVEDKEKSPDSFTTEHNVLCLDSSFNPPPLEPETEVEFIASTCLESSADNITSESHVPSDFVDKTKSSNSFSSFSPNILSGERIGPTISSDESSVITVTQCESLFTDNIQVTSVVPENESFVPQFEISSSITVETDELVPCQNAKLVSFSTQKPETLIVHTIFNETSQIPLIDTRKQEIIETGVDFETQKSPTFKQQLSTIRFGSAVDDESNIEATISSESLIRSINQINHNDPKNSILSIQSTEVNSFNVIKDEDNQCLSNLTNSAVTISKKSADTVSQVKKEENIQAIPEMTIAYSTDNSSVSLPGDGFQAPVQSLVDNEEIPIDGFTTRRTSSDILPSGSLFFTMGVSSLESNSDTPRPHSDGDCVMNFRMKKTSSLQASSPIPAPVNLPLNTQVSTPVMSITNMLLQDGMSETVTVQNKEEREEEGEASGWDLDF